MQSRVDLALQYLLHSGERFDYAAVKARANPEPIVVPIISIPSPDLRSYDELLKGHR